MKNPNWTEEEIILALDLYFLDPTTIGNKQHPSVIRLSETLNSLNVHQKHNLDINFRNPSGVATKLGNLLYLDPDRPGEGLRHGSRLDAVVWQKFANNRKALIKAAQKIKEDHGVYEVISRPNDAQIRENIAEIRKLLDKLESML